MNAQKPAPSVTFANDMMRVVWDAFDAGEAYELFKRVKRLPEYQIVTGDDGIASGVTAPARFAPLLGVPMPTPERPDLPLSTFLYDDQTSIVRMGLDAKRFACWSDCGLGKTPILLEFARQVAHRTGGRVLIVTLNEVVRQTIDEARKFYADSLRVIRLDTREEMRQWCEGKIDTCDLCGRKGLAIRVPGTACICTDCDMQSIGAPTPRPSQIAIVNYEKFNHRDAGDQVVSELHHLGGIVLDESSRLKTGGGKQKWALIKSAKGIEYKLSCTATPAPNELAEFASQASFLEKMRADSIADATQQIIWTYFTRDPKTHRWTVKRHARRDFFLWMSSWSIFVREPKRYGWRLGLPDVPKPVLFVHKLEPTPEQRDLVAAANADETGQLNLFAARELNAIQTNHLSQAAKGFLYAKAKPKRPALRVQDANGAAGCVDQMAGCVAGGDAAFPVQGDAAGGVSGVHRNAAGVNRPPRGRAFTVVPSPKPQFVADLIAKEMKAGLQVLVWTVFDAESWIIHELLAGKPQFKADRLMRQVDVLTGATAEADRLQILDDFRRGECRVLISRASMLGYGMNFQCCGSMIFSGWSFSYEQWYQAIRRAYRHGQTKRLRVHVPIIPELEGQMFDAICHKEAEHEGAIAEMEQNYIAAVHTMRATAEGRAA